MSLDTSNTTIAQNTTSRNAEAAPVSHLGYSDGAKDAKEAVGEETPRQRIVIIGAGIIGLSTAFYLSSHHPELSAYITVLDSSPELFACASGRAGGFLAKDWFVPETASLGELSFRLHRKVADEHDGSRWGYVGSTSFSFVSSANANANAKGERVRGDDWLRAGTSRVIAAGQVIADVDHEDGIVPRWLRAHGAEVELSSTGETTAQLDPHAFCNFLLEELRKRRVVVRYPVIPRRIARATDGSLLGLIISDPAEDGGEVTVPCSHILISSGPWSGKVFEKLFPSSSYKLPLTSLAGHSIILRTSLHPPRETTTKDSKDCNAVFASIGGLPWHPELFSRADGNIYFAGLNSSTISLPDVATDVQKRSEDIENLVSAARIMIGDRDDNGPKSPRIVSSGLCHRPVTPAGIPIIARVPDSVLGDLKTASTASEGGIFVATGHGPWGISLSLGTGKVMAEMLMGEPTSADVSKLGLQ